MSMPTEEQISDAIVAILKAVEGSGPVYPGYVLPKDMLIKERKSLTWDDSGNMNVCYVERITATSQRRGGDRSTTIKRTYVYLVWFYFGYSIVRDEQTGAIDFAKSSPRLFQKRVESNIAAFESIANAHLGLSNGVTHGGLNIQQQMGLTSDYDGTPHKAVGQIEVTVGNC
jgi:hypothetical protein